MNRRPPSLTKSLFKSRAFLRRPSKRVAAVAIALASLWLNQQARAADTEDDVLAGATNLGTNTTATYATAPAGTTSDVTFTAGAAYTSPLGLGAALSIGSLDDLNATPITINGSGLLTLNNTGADNVVAPANGGSAADSLFVATGASLTINDTGGISVLNSSAFDAVGTLNLGTTGVTIATGKTLSFTGGGTTTLNGVIANTTGKVLVSAGTVIFGGANLYTGGTTVNGGTLQLTNIGTANGTNSGAFTLGGGTLQINQAANNFGYNPTITLTADSTLSNIGAGAVNVGGTLTGGGHALNVNTGNARLFVNGTVATVSQFNVTAGELGTATDAGNQLNGAPVVVSSGATFDLYNGGTTAKTAANNITLNGGTGLNGVGALYRESGGTGTITETGTVTLNSTSTVGVTSAGPLALSGVVSGTGGLTKIGAGTLTLSGANTYSGQTTILNGTLSETGGSLASTTLNVGAGTFSYSVTGGAQGFTTTNLTAGATISNTIAATTLNLGTLGRPVGTAVNFGTTGTVNVVNANTGTSILGGWATTNGTSWAVSAGDGTTAGAITPLGSYTASVAGTTSPGATADVDFQASNTTAYTAQTVNSLRFNTAAATTLTLSGTNVITTGGILVTPTVGNNLSTITGGTLEGSSGGDLVVNEWDASSSLTIASVIANNTTATAFTKAGPGLVTLSGTNTYTGGTFISGGTLAVTADANLGGAGTITINGGTLQFNGPNTSSKSITLSSGHILNIGSSGGTIFDTSTTFNTGLILGTANQLTGSGTLTLTGASNTNATDELIVAASQNNFTGNIVVNSGRVEVNTSNATSPLGTGTITVNSGGELGIFANAASVAGTNTFANALFLAGAGDGVGVIRNNSQSGAANAVTFSGPVTLTANATVGSNSGSTTIFSGAISGAFTLTLNTLADNAVYGLSGVNTQSGLTFAGNKIATAKLSGSGTLGAPNVALAFSATAGVDTVDLGGTSQTIGAISNTGTILNNGGGSSVLTINGGGTTATVFKNNTTGTGTLGLTVGGGTLTLSGANTYTGATTVLAGTLAAGVATAGGAAPTSGAFGVNSPVTLNGGATLDLKGLNETIGSLSDNGGNGGTVTSSVVGTPTLTIGGLNTSTSYAGVIQNGAGTVALTKIGTGAQTLRGASTYTGATTVGGGTLTAAGTGTNKALGGTTSIAVNNGGTLLLGTSNQVNVAAPIALGTTSAQTPASTTGILSVAAGASQGSAETLTGGTAAGAPTTAGLGALTLNNNATLAFNGTATTLVFNTFTPNGNVLTITGYTNNGTMTAGNSGMAPDDRLVFMGDQTTNFADFNFGPGAGVGVGEIALDGGFYEITAAVPEPSTLWSCVLMMAAVAWHYVRRSRRVVS